MHKLKFISIASQALLTPPTAPTHWETPRLETAVLRGKRSRPKCLRDQLHNLLRHPILLVADYLAQDANLPDDIGAEALGTVRLRLGIKFYVCPKDED